MKSPVSKASEPYPPLLSFLFPTAFSEEKREEYRLMGMA